MVEHARRFGPLVFICLLTLFVNLGGPRLWDRDEPRNAGCAAEMLARHDWVVPVFNDQLRTHKPVLLYWCTMLAYQLPLDREFAARLPSACAGVLTVCLTFFLGRRMFDTQVACLAAIILPTTLMFVVASRAATPDGLLIACCSLSIYLFVRAVFVEDNCGASRWRLSIAAAWGIYAAMGLAVLAKGPIGVVLPGAIMFVFGWFDPQRRQQDTVGYRWRSVALRGLRLVKDLRPLVAIVALTVVAVPWYVWVGVRTDGVWLREFFLEHNVGRATRSMEGHGGNFLFYPAAILCGFFPWSIFAVPGVLYLWKCRDESSSSERRGLLLLLAWVGVFVGVFTVASTKLPSYVTPIYPALALLLARFLVAIARHETSPSRWLHASFAALVLVGVCVCIVLPVVAHRLLPGSEWVGLIGLIPFVAGGLAWHSWRNSDSERWLGVLSVGACAFCVSLFSFALHHVDRYQKNDVLLAGAGQSQLVAYGVLEPSWVYYRGAPIPEIARGDLKTLKTYLERDACFVITTAQDAARLKDELPGHLQVTAEVPYFMRTGSLSLLVGGPKQGVTAGRSTGHANR